MRRPQSRSGHPEEKKNLLPLQGYKPPNIQPLVGDKYNATQSLHGNLSIKYSSSTAIQGKYVLFISLANYNI
jgi:hypothetical protein